MSLSARDLSWIARRLASKAGKGLAPAPVLAMMLSLVPLLLIFQVTNGMIEGISQRFIETSTYHLRLEPRGAHDLDNLLDMRDQLQELEGLRAWPEVNGGGLLSKGSARTLVNVRGVDPQWLAQDEVAAGLIKVESGSFDLADARSIVLGSGAAEQLGASVGDRIVLTTVRSDGQNQSIPRVLPLTVSGIVSSGYRELDRAWVFMPVQSANRTMLNTGPTSFIGLKLNDPYSLPNPLSYRASEATDSLVRQIKALAGSDYRLQDWFNTSRTQFLNFMTTRSLLVFIAALVVAVSSITISSSLVLLTLEKEKDIALLRTIGAKPTEVLATHILIGLGVGGLGTVLGVFVGSLLSLSINEILLVIQWLLNAGKNLVEAISGQSSQAILLLSPEFYLDRIPVRFRLEDVGLGLVIGLGSALIASIVPAIKAARIQPAETLRKD